MQTGSAHLLTSFPANHPSGVERRLQSGCYKNALKRKKGATRIREVNSHILAVRTHRKGGSSACPIFYPARQFLFRKKNNDLGLCIRSFGIVKDELSRVKKENCRRSPYISSRDDRSQKDAAMKITASRAKILKSAIEEWMREEVIARDEGAKLLQSYEVVRFDWKRATKYSFWIALICIVIAIGSVLADKVLMELLARIFKAPAVVKSIFFAAVAFAFYYLGLRKKRRQPEKIFSTEAILFLGVLATAGSVLFFGEAIDTGSGHFSILLLLSTLVYATLGLWIQSKLIWIFALLSIGSWFGAETGYVSGYGAYFLGMNYPLRFVLFGAVLTGLSFLFRLWDRTGGFEKSTRAMGLLYLFIALWILSIFGNYGDSTTWHKVKQIELFPWALLFGFGAIAALFHGIRADDAMSRGFGLTFLFINLYTRFFEHFWDHLHKAIFFALLAVSFWYLGTRAEKIWNLGRQGSPKS